MSQCSLCNYEPFNLRLFLVQDLLEASTLLVDFLLHEIFNDE